MNGVDHKDNLLDHITNMRNPVVRKKCNMTHWVAEELRVAGHVLQSALGGNFAINSASIRERNSSATAGIGRRLSRWFVMNCISVIGFCDQTQLVLEDTVLTTPAAYAAC